ncbi:MAG TPA: hypothetical protein VGE07_00470 [Herpetosiphonaceae bacterium]
MSHGGKRSGAGRKPRAEKYQKQIAKLERAILPELDALYQVQLQLAKGGIEIAERHYEPAGTITVDGVARNTDGTPALDANGRAIKCKVLAFPTKPAEEMVLVKLIIKVSGPDRQAGQYLIDRIAGKPVQHQEISGEGGTPIKITPIVTEKAKGELSAWQQNQLSMLSSWLNARPMPPTDATTTE